MDGLPNASDPFLLRVCKALDLSPRQLAAAIDLPYKDVAPLLELNYKLADIDRDEVWWKVLEMIDLRMGLLMAARHELNKRLEGDRSKRAVRNAQIVRRVKGAALRDIIRRIG